MELNEADVTITHSATADEATSWTAVHIDTLATFEGPTLFNVVSQLEEHLAEIEE